ncbi:hypothetical protein V2J09_009551, partial [Rumex salicifolius]
VKLSIEPTFKRSITYNFTGDKSLEEEWLNHVNKFEFGDITWYPSQHTAVYRYDHRVPVDTPGDAVYDFLGFQPQLSLIPKTLRATEKGFESIKNTAGKCTMATTTVAAKKLVANGLKNNRLLFTGYPVVGLQGNMQTSGSCLHSSALGNTCAWDPRINGLFFYETTALFPASVFSSFIYDIKRLRDVNPQAFCGLDLYNGLLIRFVKGSSAYLTPDHDSVMVDFNYFRADSPNTPRLNQDIYEEIEQMAFFKYNACPHWGKNRQVAFFGIRNKYAVTMDRFFKAKEELDPLGLFSSEWSDEVLHGVEGKKFDGCALEGRCICSDDRHCSPDKGYYCKSGYVYQQARVCRYVQRTDH